MVIVTLATCTQLTKSLETEPVKVVPARTSFYVIRQEQGAINICLRGIAARGHTIVFHRETVGHPG